MVSSLLTVVFLVAVNLIPLFGVLFLGWGLFPIMVLYWLENGIVGLLVLVAVIGIVAGLTASVLISYFAQWTTEVSMLSILLAFIFSALVGVFFGYYPARKAAFMDPIEALRYE